MNKSTMFLSMLYAMSRMPTIEGSPKKPERRPSGRANRIKMNRRKATNQSKGIFGCAKRHLTALFQHWHNPLELGQSRIKGFLCLTLRRGYKTPSPNVDYLIGGNLLTTPDK